MSPQTGAPGGREPPLRLGLPGDGVVSPLRLGTLPSETMSLSFRHLLRTYLVPDTVLGSQNITLTNSKQCKITKLTIAKC